MSFAVIVFVGIPEKVGVPKKVVSVFAGMFAVTTPPVR
jgi:hypothetical protein